MIEAARLWLPKCCTGHKGYRTGRQKKLVVIHVQPCIFWLCGSTWGNARLLQILTVALRNNSHRFVSIYRPKSSYLFSFHFICFCLVLQSCYNAFIELCPRNSCYIELGMTDVKAEARPNYCCRRQPRLQGCQSELVRAGSKLSSQHFGLALHIRSLVLCRLWVLAGANTHEQTHIVLHA